MSCFVYYVVVICSENFDVQDYTRAVFYISCHHSQYREMVKKPAKALYCMFLSDILGADPAKKPGKVKKLLSVIMQLTNGSIANM